MKTSRRFSILLLSLLATLVAAQIPVRQSTARTLHLELPFVDPADGNTPVTTAVVGDLKIIKEGATAYAALNASATLTHREGGFYDVGLTASDTDTLGLAVIKLGDADSMTLGVSILVMPANSYDSIYAGTDLLQVDRTQIGGASNTAAPSTHAASDVVTALGTGSSLTALGTAANQAAIEADTQDIQSRLPAALVAGRMSSDAVAISGSTATADAVETNIGNLDASVTSRLASAGYTAPLDSTATQAAAAAAVAAYDPPTNAEMEARTLLAASYFDPATDPVLLDMTQATPGTSTVGAQLDAAGTATSGGDGWSDTERQQIRYGLGLTGTKTATSGGTLDAVNTATATTIPGAIAALNDLSSAEAQVAAAAALTAAEPIDANVTQWLGTAAATPNTAGVPIVDVGYIDGNAATDNTAALVDAILDELLSGHSTPGSLAQALTDILADTNELQTDDYPTTLASLAASIATIDAIVDSILIDTGTTLDTAITTIDTNVDSIYTEILKVPRVGQSHTYTNDSSGASEAVTISQP